MNPKALFIGDCKNMYKLIYVLNVYSNSLDAKASLPVMMLENFLMKTFITCNGDRIAGLPEDHKSLLMEAEQALQHAEELLKTKHSSDNPYLLDGVKHLKKYIDIH